LYELEKIVTQDELKDALLAALIDYETFKKTRRAKTFKQALRGTVMATVIGSTGITGANDTRGSQVSQTASSMATNQQSTIKNDNPPQDLWIDKVIWGAVYFGTDQHKITRTGEEQLKKLIKRLPRYAELTVIGCTDSKGEPLYNAKLGKQRAQTVANFLAMNGVKIKNVSNMLSENKHAGWLARRVDIIVNSSFSTQIDHPAIQQDEQNNAQTTRPEVNGQENLSITAQAPENDGFAASNATDKANMKLEITVPKETTTPISNNNKAIRGVAHFGFDQHRLTSMHKERLLDLVKQLPADAELTVIGRTDITGGDAYNKQLGMLRSKNVAIFLANHGVKIKALGNKLSHQGESGWNARRVDILVDTAEGELNINLPEPVQPHTHRHKTHPQKHFRPTVPVVQKQKLDTEQDINQWKQRAQKLLDSQLK
jgi:outer membrane protein OmpA-like peptidoglycan-associated protein